MTPASQSLDTTRMTWRDKGVLLILCGAIFLEGLDIAMLNVALPYIRADLDLSTSMLSAVAGSYVLAYAGFMLLGGRICDLFGRRRVFLLSLAIFVLLSGVGGFATNGWTLLVSRFATGLAAAFMTPAGLSLITTSFAEGSQRNRAILIYAGAASAGYSLGLMAGGVLTETSWRLVFLVPAAVAAIILLFGTALIGESRERDRTGSFDLAGALVLTTAMVCAAAAIVSLERLGRLPVSAGLCAASLFLGWVFVRIEKNKPAPLLRLGVFKLKSLVRANIAMLLFGASFFGFQFVVTLYLQELLRWSPTETGLAIIVVSIDAILAPTVTPIFVARYGKTRTIVAGLILAAVAFGLFLRMQHDWTYASMFPTMLLLGLGFALAYGPLTIVATDGVAAEEQGLASSLVNCSFQFGAGIGLATAGALAALAAPGDAADLRLEALRLAMILPVAGTIAAVFAMAGNRNSDISPFGKEANQA